MKRRGLNPSHCIGVCMLELLDFLAIIIVSGVGMGMLAYSISRRNPAKTAAKAGYDSIKTMYETYNTQVKDVLAIKDSQIKRLNAKIQADTPINEDNSTKEPINLDSLSPLLQERGINPALLTNPFVSKLIKKYTKGMGLEEIMAIVDQLGLLKGNKKSQSGAVIESGEYNPNWA